ncbi:MAG: T9SS type A sorting domain-containing protein [Ignavibacteriales bacterium]|nr:T9SS type A sorting domain-containing protein [Ignavibacteriales bacterium]
MKKVLLLTFVLSTIIFAQWAQHLPSPYGNALLGINLVGTEDVFISSFGAFIKSTNNGMDWEVKRNINGHNDLWYSVCFINSSIGWMSGNGIIIKTTNGGEDWVDQNPNSPDQIYEIRFFDSQKGIAITGQEKRILVSNNGGDTWNVKNVPSTNFLQCGYFINDTTGWVSGQNEILKTTNSGNSWVTYNIASFYLDAFFIDENIGWFVGSGGQISKTTNGGQSWTNQTSNTTTQFNSIFMIDQNTGWAVGFNGVVVKTSDGGTNWNSITTPTTEMLTGINFSDQNNGWVISNKGTILKSTDGGTNWILWSRNLESNLTNGFFLNSQVGWLTGSNGLIFKTLDSGDNWTSTIAPVINTFNDIEFADINFGWAVGNNGNIIKSTNGGSNWNTQVSGVTTKLNSISSTGTDTVFAVGLNGTILKTTDGGNNWINIIQPTSNQFSKIIKDDNNDLWICGYDNSSFTPLLLKSTDYGIGWENKFSTDSMALYAITKTNNVILISGGKSGPSGIEMLIYKSSDNGEQWSNILSIPGNINGARIIEISINNNGDYVAISLNKIFFSSDQGNTWNSESFPLETLTSLFFSDSNTGWITGQNSLVLKNTNSGITNIKTIDNWIDNYSLSQNYPNPFNPTTKISYSIATAGIVSLKIYDILGREVSTLVNEEKSAGRYEVNFNASQLASGVYFYQIKAGSFTQTKKLMLLK